MHHNGLGQTCDGKHCLVCGKCASCSNKVKTPTAILTTSHTPHTYEKPPTPAKAKKTPKPRVKKITAPCVS